MSNSVLDQHIQDYPAINWMLLAQTVEHYSGLGYQQIEVPWCVPESLNVDTKPHTDRSFVQPFGMFSNDPHELVGSAEQGFMYLMQQGRLTPGKYLSVSPCFRFDDYDATHFPWFMKVELCEFLAPDDDHQIALNQMVHQCGVFFDRLMKAPYSFYNQKSKRVECKVVAIQDTFDIEINNIEVGSYGIRSIAGHQYVYGTGLALPRFSIASR